MTKLQAATDTVKELLCWYVILLFVAAGVYMFAEHTSLDDALYWAATTATSTGYGDLSPKSIAGRIDAVLLMHLSIFVIAPMMIVRLIDNMRVDRDAFTDAEQRQLLGDVAAIRAKMGEPDYSKATGLVYAIAQLRHAYHHMMTGNVSDNQQLARGVIAPAIERLEKLTENA